LCVGAGVLEVVVGVAEGEVAQRRFGLGQDVSIVVLDVEAGPRRVVDAPDDGRGDLDRVAAQSFTFSFSLLKLWARIEIFVLA
jgi:hypothetical protein